MPIINGFFSIWDLAYISFPIPPAANADNRISWSAPFIAIVKNIEIKQVSPMSTADDVSKGSPFGHLWKSEDTIWQTDISLPFLVPAHYYTDSPSGRVENQNLPLCANLPVENFGAGSVSVATSRFIWRALSSMWGHNTANTSFRMREWGGTFDGVIQKCSIEGNDDGSSFNITILSTMDPRNNFYMTTALPITSEMIPLRVARSWDFSIPSDINILGSPSTRYIPALNDVPNRMTIASTMESGNYVAVKSFTLNVESSVDRIPSVGVGTSRPIFAIKNVKSSGTIDMIPYETWQTYGVSKIAMTFPGGKPPYGWTVDAQSLEEIGRYGGQFFVTGRPGYDGNAQPLYFEIGMRNGLPPLPMDPKYLLINRETLGPINIAVMSLRPNVGGTNLLHLEFNTSPNVDTSNPNIFSAFDNAGVFPPV